SPLIRLSSMACAAARRRAYTEPGLFCRRPLERDQSGTAGAGLRAAFFTAFGANELDAAIERAVVGGAVVHQRALHAVTLRGEARVSDPMCDEVLHHRLGTAVR